MARPSLAPLALLVPALAFGADQPLLGKSLVVKSPPGNDAGWRKIAARAVERSAGTTLSGDPTSPENSAGGILQVFLEGATPSRQTFTLPQGTARDARPFWRGVGETGFEYVDRFREHGPVQKVRLRRESNGAMRLAVKIRGAASTVDAAPPNPGTAGAVTLALATGDRYCVRFGAEGRVRNRDDRAFAVTQVTSKGCPLLVQGELLALSYNVAGLPQGISGSDPEINTPFIAPLLNGYDLVVLQETWKTPDPNPLAPTRVYHEILEAG